MIKIKKYEDSNCIDTIKLFHDTVHTINKKDYIKEQLDVWAPESIDIKNWHDSIIKNFSIVAFMNETLVGFGDIAADGYLNRIYVHKNFQNFGIGSTICNELEEAFKKKKITTHASITAKSFFANRGYKTIKEQEIERSGVKLKNYIMEKKLTWNKP